MALCSTGSDPRNGVIRMTAWIAAVNVAMFIVLNIVARFMPDDTPANLLFLSAGKMLSKPWSVVTYSFCHVAPLHLLLNMIVLVAIGYIADRMRITIMSASRLLIIYLTAGAVAGIVFDIAGSNGSNLIGASAAVMGVTAAFGMVMGKRKIELPFPGPVSLSALIFILLTISIASTIAINPGATIVHLSGIIAGTSTMSLLMLADRRQRSRCSKADRRVDQISLKMKTSGFASLSDDERKIILNHSFISSRNNE